MAADLSLSTPQDAAARLVGSSIDWLEPVGGGRNSRVYRVRAGGHDFALKQYPSRAADPRDRLGTEVQALALMERHRFDAVPRVIAVDPEQGFALLSWLDGAPLGDITAADIDQAASFLAAIHALRGAHGVESARLASEACLSGDEIARQIEARLHRLRQIPDDERELHAFLGKRFAAAFARFIATAEDRLAATGLEFTGELPQERRSLVPSDFGFHNSLRRADGSLVFFDFEYFGWDDPVKLTADVMLHPGTPVAGALVQRFRRAAERLYSGDPAFEQRLEAFHPLFGLRWVLILLNEFLPERWNIRLSAGAAQSWEEAKWRQLARAGTLLTRIEASSVGGGSNVR